MFLKSQNELKSCKEELQKYQPALVANHEEVVLDVTSDTPTSSRDNAVQHVNTDSAENNSVMTFERVSYCP